MRRVFAALCALLLMPTLASAELVSVSELRQQVKAMGR